MGLIQIDMPMPEKCEDCIFCGDSCSCVASEYDGKGINVGCAFRTGRRDIRCPLKEQETVEPKIGHWTYLQYCANEGVYCSECHTKMFDRYPMKKKLSQFCGHCGAKMDDEVESR